MLSKCSFKPPTLFYAESLEQTEVLRGFCQGYSLRSASEKYEKPSVDLSARETPVPLKGLSCAEQTLPAASYSCKFRRVAVSPLPTC